MDTIGTLELGLFLGLDWATETLEFERTETFRSDVVRVDGRFLGSAERAPVTEIFNIAASDPGSRSVQ